MDKEVIKCEVCGVEVPGFEYRYCCNSFDCDCRGAPVEPCVCSDACWFKLAKERGYPEPIA